MGNVLFLKGAITRTMNTFKGLLRRWSTECALSWKHSLCLLLSHPHAGICHQPPTNITSPSWNIIFYIFYRSFFNFFLSNFCGGYCLTFQVTVRWFSPLLLGRMIRSPWSKVSIIFSAWLKLMLWKLGWAITRFIYATQRGNNESLSLNMYILRTKMSMGCLNQTLINSINERVLCCFFLSSSSCFWSSDSVSKS